MKNFKIICLLFLVVGVFACQDNSPQGKELNAIYDKVMEIHDEVMPKMSDMNKLSRTLKKQDPEKSNPAIQTMLQRLEKEDDGMMDWMKAFSRPDYKDFDKAKAYLLSEKVKVEKVRDGMLSVIKDAGAMVEANK